MAQLGPNFQDIYSVTIQKYLFSAWLYRGCAEAPERTLTALRAACPTGRGLAPPEAERAATRPVLARAARGCVDGRPGPGLLQGGGDSEGCCPDRCVRKAVAALREQAQPTLIVRKTSGAGGEDRTPDLRFTKPLHYRCATPADALKPLRKLVVLVRQRRF